MEKLIEFIFSNPLILIAILGGLFSLLGKKGKKMANGMPNFGGDPSRGQPASGRQDSVEEESTYSSYPSMTTHEPHQEGDRGFVSYADRTESMGYSREREDSRRSLPVQSRTSTEPNTYSPEAESRGEGTKITTEQARQGVIWAEILGPPRAKRPYGRRQIK